MGLIDRLLGNTSAQQIKKIQPLVKKINALEDGIKKLSDAELRHKTVEFRERLAKGETLDQLLPEAFAVVREAAVRTIGQRHYDVQLIGGIVLHQGRISEMRTGEGKTLVATLPSYLNALPGKGVHVVTVNEYLAARDAAWMGKIHRFLGLTVGCIERDMSPEARVAAYNCDITYGTNSEFGFDYLRDNMVVSIDHVVQRDLNYAIVDEVDSILIDEARTPLIISTKAEKSTDMYKRANEFVRRLTRGEDVKKLTKSELMQGMSQEESGDYMCDIKARTVALTEQGMRKAEVYFNIDDISSAENTSWLTVAGNAADILESFGDALSKLITSLTSNTGFMNSVNALTSLFEYVSENSDIIVGMLSKVGGKLYDTFGIDIGDLRGQYVGRTQRQQTIRTVAGRYMEDAFSMFIGSGAARSNDPDVQRKEFETFFLPLVSRWARDPEKLGAVRFNFPAAYESWDLSGNTKGYNFIQNRNLRYGFFNSLSDAEKRNYFIPEGAGSYVGATPSFAAYLSSVPSMMMLEWYKDALNEYMKAPKIPNYGGAGGASGGTGTEDDLRGFSRDRRSLVINFNDKLVEWNSTITTDDPQEVVDDVSQNINALVSAAIQKALLGATNSMNSRWY